MTGRDRVKRTLRFEKPDRAPRDLWNLDFVTMHRKDELDAVLEKYPRDFIAPDVKYGKGELERPMQGEIGSYVDEWGAVWEVAEPGVAGEVKKPPLEDWNALQTLKPPWEILEKADFSRASESCAKTDLYVRAGTSVRPFERMQFLRGSENLFMDLGYGVPEIYKLRDMLHDFYCKELEIWAKTDVDGVSFMDDWGTQLALLISPKQWREFYKPLYKDYCDILRGAGKDVWFHSDGFIQAIYPDLIEIGVDAVNSQLFCMNIEEIAAEHKGKITFWGEIDRQNILPWGSVEDVREAVRRVRKAFDSGDGGVIAQCEWGVNDPRENIEAVFETWLE